MRNSQGTCLVLSPEMKCWCLAVLPSCFLFIRRKTGRKNSHDYSQSRVASRGFAGLVVSHHQPHTWLRIPVFPPLQELLWKLLVGVGLLALQLWELQTFWESQ